MKQIIKCYTWNVLLHGTVTLKLRKKDARRLEGIEMCLWKRIEGGRWKTGQVKNETRLRGGENPVNEIKKSKRNGLGIQ